MRWPLMRRKTHDQVVAYLAAELDQVKACLTAELDAERARARRRERRQTRRNADLSAVQDALEPFVGTALLPEEVLEAIEARAGSLSGRTAGRMMQAAAKALTAGQSAESVAAWMWRGEAES